MTRAAAREPAVTGVVEPGVGRSGLPVVPLVALPLLALTVPAALVLPGPLQSNGWPPRLLVFWCAAAIVLAWFSRDPLSRRDRSPVEVGGWVLLGGLVASFAATGLRPLSPEEADGALRAALVMVPLVVVAIGVAARGDRRLVDLLLTVAVAGAAVSALVAVAQFVVGPFSLAELVRPPGMVAREVGGFGERGDYTRVMGAAAHPIELGVVASALTPVAVHLARFAAGRAWRIAMAGATGLLLLGTSLSVSRSGVVVLGVAMAVYAVVLTPRQRLNLVVLALGGVVLMRAALPGLLGTLRAVFLDIPTDDSISGRTDDYALIGELVARSPLVGLGLGTFRPEEYVYIDNQYLLSLIEGGLVLAAATVAFVVLAAVSARGAVRRAVDRADASRGQALLAGILAIGVAGAFFDLFSFAQATVLFFLLAGAAGALWREAVAHGRPLPPLADRVLGRA